MNELSYRTYIFEPSSKKRIKRVFYNLTLILFGGSTIFLFLGGFPLIGFTSVISIIGALYGIKIYDDKYMGITAYGDRKNKLYITPEYFEFDGSKIEFSKIENLTIFVEEYTGKPRELVGAHHGGNNEIRFNYKGTPFMWKYIIKNKEDYKYVENLVRIIESKYPPKL